MIDQSKHLRLGDIIDALEGANEGLSVEFDFGGFAPQEIDSYRGYYSDLALSFSEKGTKVGDLLRELRDADRAVFTGYKGGEYRMDRSTPVWVANYGRCHGVAVVGVEILPHVVVLHTAKIE